MDQVVQDSQREFLANELSTFPIEIATAVVLITLLCILSNVEFFGEAIRN